VAAQNYLFIIGGFEAFHKRCSHLCEGASVMSVTFNTIGTCEHKYDNGMENISRPTQVLPFLYIGNGQNAADKLLLTQLGVTAVLNVTNCSPPDFRSNFDYMQISILDNYEADLLSHLNSAIEFIGKFFIQYIVDMVSYILLSLQIQ